MNQIYASGGKIQEGFWDNVQMPDSVRAAYGSNLKKLTKHMNGVADAGGDAKASLEDLNRIIIQNGEAAVQDTTLTQKLIGGLKSVGSTALSMAGNMALNFVVSKGLEWVIGGISDWVNRDQIAIDNGKKSQQTISDTFNEFSKGKTTLNTLGQSFASTNQQITSTGDAIQSVATKYTELSKGVDKKTNANIGLSDEDYQTYLDISSQLAKEKASAQKVYDNAKKADEKALNDLTKAQKNKDKLYSGSTKEQQILATTKGKKSYVYQNMLLTQETKNLKEQNKHRQKALKETRDSYMKAKSKYDTADADKTKSQNKILNNKSAMSKLNKTQQKALKAGKTVSTKGITDPKVLKWIQDYNEKVKKSADLSKKLRIEQEALDKATSEAAQSQAEYAQSIVENAKKKLENIANYYDSFTSQWENRNSMYEAYMDRMQTQGYNLSTKFYEAEIGQQQKIVDNLSQKYIAMKRNFAQAVQDGTIVEGTEEYYEMQNEIDQVAIKQLQGNQINFWLPYFLRLHTDYWYINKICVLIVTIF